MAGVQAATSPQANSTYVRMCMCMCVYLYLYLYMYIHTYIYMHICYELMRDLMLTCISTGTLRLNNELLEPS